MEWVTSENSKQTSVCCSHVTSQLASIPTAVTPYSISGMFLCNKIHFLFISNIRQHASCCSLKLSCCQPQTQGQSHHHAPVKYLSNLSTDLSSLSRSTSTQQPSPASLSSHQATAVTELPDSCPRVISSKYLHHFEHSRDNLLQDFSLLADNFICHLVCKERDAL